MKSSVRSDQYDQMKCGSYEFFDSKCDETMVGLKFNEDKMIQCWVGYQTEPMIEQRGKPEQTELASPLILAQTDASNQAELANETTVETHTRLGSFNELSAEERIVLAQTINAAGLTWHADPYLDDIEKALAQTDSHHGGSGGGHRKFDDGSREFQDALAHA